MTARALALGKTQSQKNFTLQETIIVLWQN